MFAALERALDESATCDVRLAPVAEFLEHIGESAHVADALRVSGQLGAMWSFATDAFARMIEQRIGSAGAVLPRTQPDHRSRQPPVSSAS